MLKIAGILQKKRHSGGGGDSSGEKFLKTASRTTTRSSPPRRRCSAAGAMASRTAQLYIIDILYALYCSLDYDEEHQEDSADRIESRGNLGACFIS